jgi:hypothetical protein
MSSQQLRHYLPAIFNIIILLIIIPIVSYGVTQVTRLINRAAGNNANIVVEIATPSGYFNSDFYHAFAQGGEETSDMLTNIIAPVKDLNPKYIRLDHIFDNYQLVSRTDKLNYNFQHLDAAIDSIIKTGAKPFLALSYMPQVIAKDGNVINQPNDWNEWSQVVKAVIEHYSGKNNRNLTDIYYEVWNEPDLAIFGKWNLEGDKNYLTLYKYAILGANNATNCNKYFIGGPATTGLNKNWIMALAQSGLRIDFISWHSYLNDPHRFVEDQNNITNWLKTYPALAVTPKIITEFGFSGDKDIRYGTEYAGIYTASVIRQLADAGPLYLFSFQLADGPNQEFGDGWGILTHKTAGAKKKPRYAVYNFLDTMTGRRLNLNGEGTWVTGLATQNSDITRILLINFDQSGFHSEAVPVKITGLTNGGYTWTGHNLYAN